MVHELETPSDWDYFKEQIPVADCMTSVISIFLHSVPNMGILIADPTPCYIVIAIESK